MGVEAQLVKDSSLAVIEGRVDLSESAKGTIVVLLAHPGLGPGDDATGVDTYVRVRPGKYLFAVPAGRYQLGAYLDRNQNGLLDPDEPVLALRGSPVIEVSEGGEVREDLVIPLDGRAGIIEPLDILQLVARTPIEQREFSLWTHSVQGEICEDLYNPRFGPEAGQRGLWEMADSLAEGISAVYFLEAYDPERTPVLFVHGISGYPREFTTLFETLDREHFQPWFYFYPSGYSLAGISDHLATLLERLQARHGFDELAVVAHSMGGLVSRGAIFRYEEATGRDDVELFLSISTPWGGDVNATSAEDAPIALPPSFADMSPTSGYISGLFYQDEESKLRRLLAKHVEYHMIFGFRMDGLASAASDGTVSLASQARLQAQEEADSIRALDYGHTDILKSPELVERLGVLLRERFGD